MGDPQQQTFTDVQPIQAAQTFSDVMPLPGVMTVSDARTIPNSRIRNMTVDPTKDIDSPGQALYEGAKMGLLGSSIPASAYLTPVGAVVGTAGATVGGVAGKGIAQAAGAGDFGQEVGEDLGGLLGGVAAEGVTRAATSGARAIWSSLPEDIQTLVRKKAVGVASPRLKNAIELWDTLDKIKARSAPPAAKPAVELDATGDNEDYAGEKPPKAQPWYAHDATGENRIPFAGGMDEWTGQSAAKRRSLDSAIVDALAKPAPQSAPPLPSPLQAPSVTPPAAPAAVVPQSTFKPAAGSMVRSAAKGSGDPLLDQLRTIAAKIQAQGGPSAFEAGAKETPKADKALDDDLTPLLLESLKQVKARRAVQ